MPRKRPHVVLLHYTTPAIVGGVEQVMGAHAAGLRELGVRVTVVAGRGRPAPRGVPRVLVPEVDSLHPAVIRDFAALARGEVTPEHTELSARIERRLRPILAKADCVVVHNAFTMHLNAALTQALVRLARERPGAFIAWTHDLAWVDAVYASERHGGRPWDLFAQAIAGVRYVAITHERGRQLSELTGLARERICVVPNGVDLVGVLGLSATGARLAERLDLLSADPLLLLPARLTRRKRVEAAIAATGALRARGRDAALVVTGPPGPHNLANRQYVADLVALARHVPRVHLLYPMGIRARFRVVADLYALADLLVLPSANEGFGIPLLEAALYRLPIVCSDLPTLRETAGDAARYVPPDASGEVIADAIEASLASPLERLRERAHTLAWPRLIAERVAPVVLEGLG